jgi:hypothetical protein
VASMQNRKNVDVSTSVNALTLFCVQSGSHTIQEKNISAVQKSAFFIINALLTTGSN